jgi:hypothetical protein
MLIKLLGVARPFCELGRLATSAALLQAPPLSVQKTPPLNFQNDSWRGFRCSPSGGPRALLRGFDCDWRANVERSQAARKIFERGVLWQYKG